jgi:putative acetyltransferase
MTTSTICELADYPKDITLRDNTIVVLKPMTQEDTGPLLHFFVGVPEADRHYLKEDITSPQVVQRWAAELDYDRALPLLAWIGNRVVADATLHRNRAGARRHVGELRILVDQEYRNRGLGTTLIRELVNIAEDHGLERLLFVAVADKEEPAIKAARFLGFEQIGVLRSHAKDPDGHPRDLVIMEMPLGRAIESAF